MARKSKRKVAPPAKVKRQPELAAEALTLLRNLQRTHGRIRSLCNRIGVGALPKIPARDPRDGISATISEATATQDAISGLLDTLEQHL